MPIATDVRAYADAALKQGKTALSQASTAVNTATERAVELVEDAPKPVFAFLGAADLAVETVAKHLPKGATDAYRSTAKDVYGTLTARGEAKIAALRHDPRLAKLRGEVSGAAETLQANVAPVAHTVQSKVGPVAHSVQARVAPVIDTVKSANPLRKPAPRAAPARKAPARKAPAKKAPGAEATPSA
jgi:heparin binding hemagglutinin HbhA